MKEKLFNQAMKNWNECFRLKIYDISFLDILEQMYKTTNSEMKARIINELINEEINR